MLQLLKEKLRKLIKKKEEEINVEKVMEEEEADNNIKGEIERDKNWKKDEKKESREEAIKRIRIKDRFRIGKIKISEERFKDFYDELRLILWQNNVAEGVVDYIEERLKSEIVGREIKKKEFEEFIRENLREVIRNVLINPPNFIEIIKNRLKEKKPFVIVFFGINGSGKTTTIAKIAYLLKKNNLTCVFAASDTFRAASIEQLEKHGKNLNIKVIKHRYGSDPAAVGFDAIKYAKTHNIDVVLIDTSGRMHTDKNLLEEMKKICRVNNPDLKIFVGEAIVGNDAIEQARVFNDEIGIDGIILTKFDVDEKGGAALSISYVTKKPIFFLGIGQKYEDIEIFNKNKIVCTVLE